MKKKYGFTLIELLVVIGIIAVLSVVGIIGYISFTDRARLSRDISSVTEINTVNRDSMINKKKTMQQTLEHIEEFNINIDNLTNTQINRNIIVWDSVNDEFLILDKRIQHQNEEYFYNCVYPDTNKTVSVDEAYKYFAIYDEVPSEQHFSIYLTGNKTFDKDHPIDVSVGFDIGSNTAQVINYTHNGGEEDQREGVVLRTNKGTLNYTSNSDSLYHYGEATDVNIIECADHSYHECGGVHSLDIKEGHIVVENGSIIGNLTNDDQQGQISIDLNSGSYCGNLMVNGGEGESKSISLTAQPGANAVNLLCNEEKNVTINWIPGAKVKNSNLTDKEDGKNNIHISGLDVVEIVDTEIDITVPTPNLQVPSHIKQLRRCDHKHILCVGDFSIKICEDCGMHFFDTIETDEKNENKEITDEAVYATQSSVDFGSPIISIEKENLIVNVSEAHKHSYSDEPYKWEWSSDYSVAKAVFKCDDLDCYHTFTIVCPSDTDYSASITSEVTLVPTCLEVGNTTYTASCKFNDVTHTDSKTWIGNVPALGHDLVHHAPQAETCTELGWAAYDTCTRCDYSTYSTIPVLGHDLVHHDAQAPTCTEHGWEAYDTCSRCDYTTYVERSALGHTPASAVIENVVAPTCLLDGSHDEVVYCSVCNVELSREHIVDDAFGHDYEEIVTEPTYETGGYTTHTCTRCGDSYVDSPTAQKVHNYLSTWSYDDNTHWHYCTDSGYGDLRSEETAHTYGEGVVTAPTYEAKGYTTYTCTVCGHFYKDNYTDQLAHNYSTDWSYDENEHWHACTDEGYPNLKTGKASHSYGEDGAVTPPTTTDYGYTTYTCTVCGHQHNDDFTDPLPTVQFENRFVNSDQYLYRVGNQNTIKLGTLFKVTGNGSVDSSKLSVEFKNKQGTNATYTSNATWTEGTIQFSRTGVIRVELIYDNQKMTDINLEVIDAINSTAAKSATDCNVVMLNDAGFSQLSVKNGYTLYGNGFTLTCSSDQAALDRAYGFISLENGTLNNINVVVPNFPEQILYSDNMKNYPVEQDKTRYAYVRGGVFVSGGESKIINSYISGGRAPVVVKGDVDLLIESTTLFGGACANLIIDGGTLITLSNVTTIQKPLEGKYWDDNHSGTKTVMGLGIVSMDPSARIVVKNGFTQYNWICSTDSQYADSKVSPVLSAALEQSQFLFNYNGKNYANTGIVYLETTSGNLDTSNVTNGLQYGEYNKSIVGFSAYVKTLVSNGGLTYEQVPFYHHSLSSFNYELSDKIETYPEPNLEINWQDSESLAFRNTQNKETETKEILFENVLEKATRYPTITIKLECKNGDVLDIDFSKLISLNMYGADLDYTLYSDSISIVDKKATIGTNSGTFNVLVNFTNNTFYNKEGNAIEHNIDYSYELRFIVIDSQIEGPKFIVSDNIGGTDNSKAYKLSKSSFSSDWGIAIPVLDGIKVQYYSKKAEGIVVFDFSSYTSIPTNEEFELTVTSDTWKGGKYKTCVYNGKFYHKTYDTSSTYINGSGTPSRYNNVYYTFKVNGQTISKTIRWDFNQDKFTNSIAYNSFSSSSTNTIYSVYLNVNKGDALEPENTLKQVSSGNSISLPTPTRSGYSFDAWYTAADGGTKVGGAGTSYKPTAGITLYAHWKTPSTVSFDSTGGSFVEDITDYSNTAISLPYATKDGFWLLGWFDGNVSKGKIGDSYIIPEDDITLVAHWSPVYTVTFDANGGTCGTNSYKYQGSSLTLPTPSYGSMTFEGWYTSASGGTKVGNAGDSYTPTANITLHAQWSNNILVTFNANGGNTGTNSDTYDYVTPITLPTATWAGHQFNGWYTAVSGGTKAGNAGASYTPSEATTLYAQWTAYTVSFDGNGVSNPSSLSAGSNGSVTLPSSSRTGYTFNGWYTATSGGTKISGGGASYTPTANITLHAQWTVNTYKITITTSNSSTAVTVNGTTVSNNGSIAYNSVVKVVLSYSETDSLTFAIKQGNTNVTYYSNEACTSSTTSTDAGTYYFKMPAGAVTINSSSTAASSGGVCLLPTTLITLADGSQKMAKDLTIDDEILSYNHITGTFEAQKMIFNVYVDESEFYIINLSFSDGSTLDLASGHGLFNLTNNSYEIYYDYEFFDHIGEEFATVKNVDGEFVIEKATLVSVKVELGITEKYSPLTEYNVNCVADGLLTIPDDIEGMWDSFRYTDNLMIDLDELQKDIETYGVYSYEDVCNVVPEYVFDVFNFKYWKAFILKGTLSYDKVNYWITRYVPDIIQTQNITGFDWENREFLSEKN